MLKSVLLILMFFMSLSAHAVVILQYHHVSEDTPSVTSVTPAQFRQQMAFLSDNGFKVKPLSEVVESIKQGQDLADKTVAITFDDGYQNIADNAHPILKEYGFPYAIFIAVEPIEQKYRDVMSWDTLNRLSREGAELANHSWGHEHLIRHDINETQDEWLTRIEDNLLSTEAEILAKTGQHLKMLAYPYGEYNLQLEALLKRHGFVGFGQQSGAAGKYSSLTALPRFPVAGVYAELSSLQAKLYSLNMPVLALEPANTQLSMGNWRPELKITLDMSDIYPHQLMCFVQGQGAVKPLWTSENEFTVRAALDLPAGRSRYNCTAPSKATGRYYWFSQAWVRPKNDGTWVEE
ncbi:polysaccharide deacetylase family protein [Shewanella psychrotolerans]|uniref:polysaccharide deacetylase family protein n=1 Tax=Shewanella psychrotolerans TaxID=2864206 RepID=UPI001C65C52F|nr:polysaccharide deacetylase family protein [Shewanella psychrotolerans]QYK01513.1 polysaccharide deacetylase family protein [Shewanella psychrotolerans]